MTCLSSLSSGLTTAILTSEVWLTLFPPLHLLFPLQKPSWSPTFSMLSPSIFLLTLSSPAVGLLLFNQPHVFNCFTDEWVFSIVTADTPWGIDQPHTSCILALPQLSLLLGEGLCGLPSTSLSLIPPLCTWGVAGTSTQGQHSSTGLSPQTGSDPQESLSPERLRGPGIVAVPCTFLTVSKTLCCGMLTHEEHKIWRHSVT